MAALRHLARRLRRFRFAEAGTAAVEFALILPIMLFVYVGMVEASALITMDRKVQAVSGAVGDLVSRSQVQIKASELLKYVQVAGGIMSPYDPSPLQQTVSQVRILSNGTTSVDWSKSFVHQVLQSTGGHAQGSAYALPPEMIALARRNGNYVIVAESRYSYLPLFGIVFKEPINLYRENVYMPRYGDKINYLP